MSPRIRRTLVSACLCALALPAVAGAAPDEVAPPGGEGEGTFSTAAQTAATDPGCRAKNVIAFREVTVDRSRVRHSGLIRCSRVNVRIACAAKLFRGNTPISDLRDRGSDRCRIGTPFAQSAPYRDGSSFTQKYRYELTLKNRRKQWAGTTRKCPERRNDRRTLICKGTHSTLAPEGSKETIRS